MFKTFSNFKLKNHVNSGGAGIGLTFLKKLCDILEIEIKFNSIEGERTSFTLIIENKH